MESKVLFLLKSLLYFVADLLISNFKFVDILLRRQMTTLPSLYAPF